MGGVYGIIKVSDTNNIKLYIGSSKDIYQRFLYHYKGRYSNIRLKRSIAKYGIVSFTRSSLALHLLVINSWYSDPEIRLTNIETSVIKSFPFEDLYN